MCIRHRFQELLSKCTDSAAGPDGIPYSAWKAWPTHLSDIIRRLYNSLLHGVPANKLPQIFKLSPVSGADRSVLFDDILVVIV